MNNSDGTENDELSGIVTTNFVDDGTESKTSIPNFNTSISTGPQRGLTKEEKIGRKLYLDCVKAEQRGKLLQSLVDIKVGTNRVESNQVERFRTLSKKWRGKQK